MTYDRSNIFAKILRGEIPVTPLYEDAFALAFSDIRPQRVCHMLVIPKGEFVSFDDFCQQASPEQQLGFFRAVQKVAAEAGLSASGYRLIANHGADSGQEVPHFHVHIVGGETVGPLVNPSR